MHPLPHRVTNLGLVLRLHVSGSQDLGVDPLGQPCVDVLPRSPDGQTEHERPRDAERRVPDDPPEEGVQEVEHQVR